jgi:hypothetical protein
MRYREIMTWTDKSRMEDAKDILRKGPPNYQLRYYDIGPEIAPPLLVFIIIDQEEVVIGFHRKAGMGDQKTHFAINHPKIVAVFQDYYDLVWEKAKPLKEEGKPEKNTLPNVLQIIEKLMQERFPKQLEE